MKLEHIAIWTKEIEGMKDFYEKFFMGKANEKYVNENKHFESYFLTFENGMRLELMRNLSIVDNDQSGIYSGYAHMAFSLGSKEKVDALTSFLKVSGYEIKSEPRTTGDGYYESSFLDPDGNLVEITA